MKEKTPRLRATVIANPVSGGRRASRAAEEIACGLRKRGAAVELRTTDAPGTARRLATEAVRDEVPVVVGCGGDGTMQELAEALRGASTALAVFPGGRCNDLALALGQSVPGRRRRRFIERLCAAVTAEKPAVRQVDLGLFRPREGPERVFCTVATLGFDTAVSRFVEQRRLPVKGTLAYIYGVLRLLPGFRFPMVKLRGGFGESDGRVLLVATGNTACYGGAMQIVPPAVPDDGRFHLCVVKQVPRWTVLSFLPRVLRGSHLGHPAVTTLTTAEFSIETPDGEEWVCADGETLGKTPCTLTTLPGALRVVDLRVADEKEE